MIEIARTAEAHGFESLIALSAAAARTERVRLPTGVRILPQANPLLLAKQAARDAQGGHPGDENPRLKHRCVHFEPNPNDDFKMEPE